MGYYTIYQKHIYCVKNSLAFKNCWRLLNKSLNLVAALEMLSKGLCLASTLVGTKLITIIAVCLVTLCYAPLV
jgi:hypothetical protein